MRDRTLDRGATFWCLENAALCTCSSAEIQRKAEWARVASEGKDVERVDSHGSDDAVVVPLGQPAAGAK
jgi:hypothetical protein